MAPSSSGGGASDKNVEDILAGPRLAERLCSSCYDAEGSDRRTEHEAVSRVVTSICLGLDWSHQQIAVEWRKIEMVPIKRTPTTPDTWIMVLEAKGLGKPLADRHSQVRCYVDRHRLEAARYIATTDAASAFRYEKAEDGWHEDPTPIRYLDICSLQRRYRLPKGTDLLDTLIQLQPNSV